MKRFHKKWQVSVSFKGWKSDLLKRLRALSNLSLAKTAPARKVARRILAINEVVTREHTIMTSFTSTHMEWASRSLALGNWKRPGKGCGGIRCAHSHQAQESCLGQGNKGCLLLYLCVFVWKGRWRFTRQGLHVLNYVCHHLKKNP